MLVVKIGGNILDNPEQLHAFLVDFAQLQGPKLLVHGGGKIASAIGLKLGIEPKMIKGRRITDAETLDLVTMVYGGLINKQLVASLHSFNCQSIGLTGADANLILASKREAGEIAYGFAGDIKGIASVNVPFILNLLKQGITPVVAPLTHDGKGSMLNTNADTMAATLAMALAASCTVDLLYCFEKPGVLQHVSDDASVISKLTSVKYDQMKEQKLVHDGMLPKLDNAFAALREGVSRVFIADASSLKALAKNQAIAGTTLSLS